MHEFPASEQLRHIKAVHPHWEAVLRLSQNDGSVFFAAGDSRGKYVLSGNDLIIDWERYGRDYFIGIGNDVFVSRRIDTPELRQLRVGKIGSQMLMIHKYSLTVPGSDHEVFLRAGTSDAATFNQVFVDREYAGEHLPANAEYIIDLGANIGLAAIFFSLRYPNARLTSVEPHADNFDMTKSNTDKLRNSIMCVRGAAWHNCEDLSLLDEDPNGNFLGEWGFQVSPSSDSGERILGYTVDKLMELAGYPKIDILKVDIEGAELELFSYDYDKWLSKTDYIIIETHDRFREGSEAAVRLALNETFTELPRRGENLFFSRNTHTCSREKL